jgi:hypothetical protein
MPASTGLPGQRSLRLDLTLQEASAAYKKREGTLDDGEQLASGVGGMTCSFEASNTFFLLGDAFLGDGNVEVEFFEFAGDSHRFAQCQK